MIWHRTVVQTLEASGLFQEVELVGAKVRARIDAVRFLDIHYDPVSKSYSYALIDLRLPYPGDKRWLGWDDYPHEGVAGIRQLESYPHHFHRRAADGSWVFEASRMRGEIAGEMDAVLTVVADYLRSCG